MSVPAQSTVTIAIPPQRRIAPWAQLGRDPQALITVSVLSIIVVAGILAPVLAPHGPNEAPLAYTNAPVGTPGYPLGADQNGRDILSRLLYSINTSMVSALVGVSVALLVGIPAGLIGGYFGKRTRGFTEWIFSLIMTFPGLLLLIILMPVTQGDYVITMMIFGVIISPGIYRIVRNQVVGVKNELYVDAARVSGLPHWRILGRHVLYVVRGPVIIAAAFLAGSSIGIQSGLAFLGLGSADVPSFGAMISAAFANLYKEPVQVLWPCAMLGVISACFVLLGNSLRDALEGSAPKPSTVGTPRSIGVIPTASSASTSLDDCVISVTDLAVAYPAPHGELVEVVHAVSLAVAPGQTLGLVGESGSGKTQTAFAMMGLLPAEAVLTRGSIQLKGFGEIRGRDDRGMRRIRGTVIGYIPQEPMSNLVPTYTVGAQLVDGLRASTGMSHQDARARILTLLERCGIADPRRVYDSYPHQISGGMAQRVLIAGAVAPRPRVLIADEPTTALDVTVQAEILDLLRDLQQEMGMAIIMVTHNFGVVADICDHIAVMQRGRVVESGTALDVFDHPKDGYTRMLLGAILDESTVRVDPPHTSPIGARI